MSCNREQPGLLPISSCMRFTPGVNTISAKLWPMSISLQPG